MATEQPKVCPAYCRKCGVALVLEKEWLKEVKFSDTIFKSPVFDYRIILTCPRRLQSFGFWYDGHDRREFDRDDCSIEYPIK